MDGFSTFLIFTVLGLFVYGRALRLGILSAASSGAPAQNANAGVDSGAVIPGSCDLIPNSNGTNPEGPSGPQIQETGTPAAPSGSSGKTGIFSGTSDGSLKFGQRSGGPIVVGVFKTTQ